MNAFERLIDRSLFAGLGLESPQSPGDAQEASNSWTLLQAMLRQNDRARSYTQKLLLKKAREQPGIRPRSMERFQALLELWPVAERDAMLTAFGEAPLAGAGDASPAPNAATAAAAAGTSTPPRRQSHTPDWGGPMFSESPALPGSQRQVSRDRGYGTLEDSAVTVQIRGSREAVGDSATTLASRQGIGTSTSLDAWLPHAGSGDLTAQMRRTRSLPASALVQGAQGTTAATERSSRSRAPQLVLDFGPSGSSEDDRARTAQLRPQLLQPVPREEAPTLPSQGSCLQCGDVFMGDANFCRKCGRPREVPQSDRFNAGRRSTAALANISSGSGAEISRRRGSSQRHSLPNAPSASEDEMTLDPEVLKVSSRKKSASRSSSKRLIEASSEEKRRISDEAALEKLQLKAKSAEAALVEAEARLSQALAESKAMKSAKEAAEAQALSSMAELHVLNDAKGQAEAQRALSLTQARASLEAKEAAEASVAVALAEAKAALKRKEEAEAQAANAQEEASVLAQAKEEAEAELQAALAEAQAESQAAKEAEQRRQTLQEALAEAKETREAAEARASSVAQQAEVAVHARQAAEAKSKASQEALQLTEQRLQQALQQASEAKAAADAWAAEASEAAKRAKGKEVAHQRLAARCAEAQPRWLAQVVRGAGILSLSWAFGKLLKHCVELRHEQRLGLAVATKAQSLQHEHHLVLESVRLQLEERLQDLTSQREELLEQTAKAMARELQMASSLSQRQQLSEAFSSWRLQRQRSQAARRLERLLTKHLQRRHLQLWRRQTEVDLLSYLEVQIDCFENFTTKRNALCWRVLRRAGGYWSSEQQDLTLLALLAAWQRCTQETHWQLQRRRWGARKLADVGLRLLRRHLWAPWLSWQQAEQDALTSAMRTVEESHAREEAQSLKRELEELRFQALSQRDTFAAEFSAVQNEKMQLKESSESTAVASAHRSWRFLSAQLRGSALRALLQGLRQQPGERRRCEALESSWRCLVSMLLAEHPWRLRSDATILAVEKLHLRRQQSIEVLRQRRPLVRLAAFGSALRQRERKRFCGEVEKCLRDVSRAQCVLQRCSATLLRLAQRWALRRLQQATQSELRDARRVERWEAMLQSWSEKSALANAKEAQKATAAQFLVHMLVAQERQCCLVAVQRWRSSAVIHSVQVAADRRVAAHCESKRQLRLQQGLSILSGVVQRRLQLALSQAMLGQWRVLRWQQMVGSLDASLARDHRRMMEETDLLRSQLVQSQDEALALRTSQAQEAQEALQMKLQAEANLEILRNDCAAQASRLLDLEDAQVSKDQLVERLKHRCHQAKVKRESFHHYQAKDLHRQVIFHAWLSVSRQDLALEAKKNAGAHMALQILAALARHRLGDALQCWRGKAMARAVEVASQRSLAEQYEVQREVRVQHGASILDQLMRRRLQQALLGHWRVLRWQHMVRSLDSSFARDQRRMLAETDSLRSQLVQSHDEALELRALKASEANKALRTQQEAEAIVEAVKKERANQAAKLQDMEASKNAMEQLCSKLRDQLDQAMCEVSQLDNEKRNAMQQLCSLQSDLDDAQRVREEMSQAEMQRERAFQEQVQALQQRALSREAELQDAAQRSEKTLEQKLHEKQRAVELQTSIAEDQEKNIRHLEDLLKEQGEVLSRERNDHQRGLNALRASASLSESKTSLLQEQVVALRQQLQREHQELMASERAWSSDRAALLSAVTNHPIAPEKFPGAAKRSSSAKARKVSPTPKGSTRCPWHGAHGSKKLAPALM